MLPPYDDFIFNFSHNSFTGKLITIYHDMLVSILPRFFILSIF